MRIHPNPAGRAVVVSSLLRVLALAAAAQLGLGAVSGPAAGAAYSRTEAELEEAVRETLMSRHPDDTPEWWRGLGPAAPKVLMRMYEGESSVYHRMRLIEGLSAFVDDASAVGFIKEQADRTSEDVIRNNAIRMIGLTHYPKAGGGGGAGSAGSDEEDWLSHHLSHPDPHTRVAAATALRRAGSRAALAKVDRFMAEEKLPWVVAKLKGEAPKPLSPLSPTASSEDRLSPDLAGHWQGYWLAPKAGASKGLESRPVELRLDLSGLRDLGGQGVARAANGISRAIGVGRATGKGARWSGVLVEEIPARPSAATRREEQPCDGELLPQTGGPFLQIRLPRTGGLIFLRRDPSGPR